MNIIHIMADGTIRKSIDGIVIPNKAFYTVANTILEKKAKQVHRSERK